MVFLTRAWLIALGLSATAHALQAVIIADTNRDGKVDEQDLIGRDKWTKETGAIFMANIGDSGGRCSKTYTDQTPNDQLDKCHDAADDKQRNPKYLAHVKIPPTDGMSGNAKGTIQVLGSTDKQHKFAKKNVRVFWLKGDAIQPDAWEYLNTEAKDQLNAADLKKGITLGIDARDFRRPQEWDGFVTLKLTLSDTIQQETISSADQVQLRVAPLLIHHNLQKLEQLYTVSDSKMLPQFANYQKSFLDNLRKQKPLENIKVEKLVSPNRWVQDSFESGYTSIPGENGPVVLRVLIRSPWSKISQERMVFTEMRSDQVGAVQLSMPNPISEPLKSQLDLPLQAMGNIEAMPPHTIKGNSFPNGRIIAGTFGRFRPSIVEFLEHQDAPAVSVDLSWSRSQHIDEFAQFFPAKNDIGWVMAVPDPMAGLKLLKDHGKSIAMPRPITPDITHLGLGRQRTAQEVIDIRQLENFNKLVDKRVKGNIKEIMDQTGIRADHIVEIPTVYYHAPEDAEREIFNIFHDEPKAPPPFRYTNGPLLFASSLYGNFLNGIVFNDGQYLAPQPWGPKDNLGNDVFEVAAKEKLRGAGVKVSCMDDWWSHHVFFGEIHCGTNGLRDASQKWWLPLDQRKGQPASGDEAPFRSEADITADLESKFKGKTPLPHL